MVSAQCRFTVSRKLHGSRPTAMPQQPNPGPRDGAQSPNPERSWAQSFLFGVCRGTRSQVLVWAQSKREKRTDDGSRITDWQCPFPL